MDKSHDDDDDNTIKKAVAAATSPQVERTVLTARDPIRTHQHETGRESELYVIQLGKIDTWDKEDALYIYVYTTRCAAAEGSFGVNSVADREKIFWWG